MKNNRQSKTGSVCVCVFVSVCACVSACVRAYVRVTLYFFQTRSSRGRKHLNLIHSQCHWAKCFSFIVFCICLSVCHMPKMCTLFYLVHIKKRSLLTCFNEGQAIQVILKLISLSSAMTQSKLTVWLNQHQLGFVSLSSKPDLSLHVKELCMSQTGTDTCSTTNGSPDSPVMPARLNSL